jgi:ABC-2 type transport system permease protein
VRRLLAAELLKLRTTRTSWILAGAALALVALFHLLNFTLKDIRPGADVANELQLTGTVVTLTLVLGILGVAGEYRHGTMRVTLLVTLRRGRVLAAKVIAYALAGALLGALASAVTALMLLPWLSATGTAAGLSDGRIAGTLAAFVPLAAGGAVMGVGLGAIVRSQAGAVAVAVVWTAIVDGLLASAVDAYTPYSLDGASDALTGSPASLSVTDDLLAPWAGFLVLVAYTAVLVAVGAVLLSRRDVG